MGELTILMLIFAIGLYVLSLILKRTDLHWLTFFISICSIGTTLTDEVLTNDEVVMAVVPVFYVMLMSGVRATGIVKQR